MQGLIFSTHTKTKKPSTFFINQIETPAIEDTYYNQPIMIDQAKLFGGETNIRAFITEQPRHPLRIGMFDNLKNAKKCGTCGQQDKTIVLSRN